MRFVLVVAVVLALQCTAAQAKETPEQACERAEAFLKQGDGKSALKVYTVALLAAHKARDLVAEVQIAQSLNKVLERRAGKPVAEEDLTTDEILARLMQSLGTKHRGAVLSGFHCATRILMRATRTGERTFVRSAAELIATASKDKKRGTAAQVIGDYAAGFLAYGERKYTEADARWNKALDAALEHGWLHVALHATVEIAARNLEQGVPGPAVDAMEKFAAAFPKGRNLTLAKEWQRLMDERLANAPGAIREPYGRATGFESTGGAGGSSAHAAGGKGGEGGAGGRGGSSGRGATPLEKALEKYGSRKPLVAVKRTESGYEVEYLYEKDADYVQEAKPGIVNREAAGITLAFCRGAVGLRLVNPTGRLGGVGQPGEGRPLPDFLSFHPLKVGEKLRISRGGTTVGR